jgi:type IV pilus assembly protein PilA
MTHQHRGFTLTEILIVITIIVILALAFLIGLNPIAQIFKGYDSRRKSDLQKIKIALESYYSDHDCYPDFRKTGVLDDRGNPSYLCESDFLKPYLAILPCDPNSKKPYTIAFTPPDSACSQQFAVYAQIFSFFDKNANLIPYCPKTFAVSSPNSTEIDLVQGCSDERICYVGYGCINGSCVQVSEGTVNPCKTKYCEPGCNNVCDNASNACYP